jgi:hypothetical protein
MPITTSTSYKTYVADKTAAESLATNANKTAAFSSLVCAPQAYAKLWFAHIPAKLPSILQSVQPHINLSARNTWEFPHKHGLVTHEAMIEAYALHLETHMQDLMGHKLDANQLAQIRWRRQVYAALHDSGKAWKGFSRVEHVPDTLTPDELKKLDSDDAKIKHLSPKFKCKPVEDLMTKLFMLKSIFVQDSLDDVLLEKLTKLVQEKLTQGMDYFSENDADFKPLKQQIERYIDDCVTTYRFESIETIDTGVFNSARTQQLDLFDDISIMLKDTVGGYIKNYCQANDDAKRMEIVTALHEDMHSEYNEMSDSYKQENSIDIFVHEKLSNFLADISYYPNLHLIYFDKENLPLPEFDKILRMFGDMHANNAFPVSMPKLIIPIEPKQPVHPVPPRGWSTTYSPFNAEAKAHMLAMTDTLNIFASVKSLRAEINTSADTERFAQGYRVEHAGDDVEPKHVPLMEIIEAQSKNLQASLNNPKTKAIMASYIGKFIN